jgi:hypothetical protein
LVENFSPIVIDFGITLLKTSNNVNYSYTFSSYHSENASRLGYEKAKFGNNLCFFF